MSQEVFDLHKELNDNGIRESSVDDLTNQYQKLINEMSSEFSNNRVKEQIDELYRTFRDSLMNEQKLIKLYRESRKKQHDDSLLIKKMTDIQRDERREIDILHKKHQILQKEFTQAKEDKARELANNDMSQLSDKHRDDYSVDENQMEKLEKEKNFFKRQFEQMTLNFEKVDKDFNDLTALKDKLENTLKEYKSKNVELLDDKDKLKDRIKILEKEAQDKVSEINNIRNFNTSQTDKLKEQYDNLITLNLQLKDLNSKVAEHKKSNDKNYADKVELDKAYKKVIDESLVFKNKIEELEEKLKKSNQNIKKLEKDRERTELNVTEREVELREKNRQIDKINKEVNNLELTITAHKNDIRLLNQEMDSYKKLLSEEGRQKHEQIIANKNQEKDIKKTNEKVKELNQELIDYKGDINSKSEILLKTKEELSIANKINSDLEKTRDKITEENTKLKNKIDYLLEDVYISI